MLTGLDDSFCLREAVKLVWSVKAKNSLSVVSPWTGFIFMAKLLAFPFTEPVEELLLTELDDAFISRVSFREVAELVYSVPSDSVCVSGFSTCRDLMRM